jgi:prepilin-type N-terminal cleavage/methylation domain-containing protein
MLRAQRGFTLIELIVIITVIAILTGIGVFGFITYQQQGRDTERQTQTKLIAEALEKYYDENGEYPGCEAITTDPGVVQKNTLTSLSSATFLAPNAPDGTLNSIQCNDIEENSTEDYFAFVGDGSSACTNGSSCASWKLRYKEERTGAIITINSRRSVTKIDNQPDLTLALSGLNTIGATWSAIPGALSYEVQYATSASFAAPTTSSNSVTTASYANLALNTTYYFRVRAILPGTTGAWSNTESKKTAAVPAPAKPVVTATLSGTTVKGVASGSTCSSGTTVEYQLHYKVDTDTYSAYTTTSSLTLAGEVGKKYTFQAQARCKFNTSTSAWVQSAESSVTVPITAPSGLTVSAAVSGANVIGTASGGSCATGTTIERQLRYQSSSTATAGAYDAYVTASSRTIAANQGWKYVFQQQARCKTASGAASAWVASSTASAIRPIAAPAAPTVSVSTSGTTTTFTASAPTCPTGTTRRYQYKYVADWNYDSGWYTPTTATVFTWNTQNQGYQYTTQLQAHCYTVHNTSPWSATGSGSYIRPVDAPGPISWSIARGASNIVYLYGASTCGPGVSLYAHADIHTWDINWAGTSSRGWWASVNGGNWLRAWNYWGNPVMVGSQNNAGAYASGTRWNMAMERQCKNSTTGRGSAVIGRQESPILYLP